MIVIELNLVGIVQVFSIIIENQNMLVVKDEKEENGSSTFPSLHFL